MACEETLVNLETYVDGELEPHGAAALERHVAECAPCRHEFDEVRALSDAVRAHATRFKAPDALAGAISKKLRAGAAATPRRRVFTGARLALAATIVLAAVFAGLVSRDLSAPDRDGQVAQEVADAHRRSLTTGHWTEFAASDRRALASWVRDRGVRFSPPIADLSAEGYALVGGRREVVDGRTALAVVYRRGGDTVDLFVAPAPSATATHARLRSSGNVNVVAWTEPGLAFWAVSQIDGETLRTFHKSIENAIHPNEG